MSTYEEWQQAADLRFMNFYDDTLRQLRTDVGLAIAEFDGRGALHSSMYYSRRHQLVAAAAKKLSLTRLEMDLSALLQRGLPIKVNEDKLKSHQYNLLREQFWMNYVLAEFKKTGRPESVAEYETHIWNELDNLYHQAERLIAAAALDDASPKLQIQQPIIQNNYINNGGQQNVAATENASIYATQVNNYSDMEQLATQLAELLKASNLPADVKEEAVDLAETVAEQAKSGQPRKGVLKSLSNVLQAVNDTNGLLKAGKDLYDTASQMGELIKPFIS